MTFARYACLAICAALTLTAAGPGSVVQAHDGAMGVTKERMDIMKGMADAMKAMGLMLKGEAPFDPEIIATSAGYLVKNARTIPDLTPKGSNALPSEALDAIWQDWDRYVDSANQLADEGAKLVEISENGHDLDTVRAQFAKLGRTCGSCHDAFRKPKD